MLRLKVAFHALGDEFMEAPAGECTSVTGPAPVCGGLADLGEAAPTTFSATAERIPIYAGLVLPGAQPGKERKATWVPHLLLLDAGVNVLARSPYRPFKRSKWPTGSRGICVRHTTWLSTDSYTRNPTTEARDRERSTRESGPAHLWAEAQVLHECGEDCRGRNELVG